MYIIHIRSRPFLFIGYRNYFPVTIFFFHQRNKKHFSSKPLQSRIVILHISFRKASEDRTACIQVKNIGKYIYVTAM